MGAFGSSSKSITLPEFRGSKQKTHFSNLGSSGPQLKKKREKNKKERQQKKGEQSKKNKSALTAKECDGEVREEVSGGG